MQTDVISPGRKSLKAAEAIEGSPHRATGWGKVEVVADAMQYGARRQG